MALSKEKRNIIYFCYKAKGARSESIYAAYFAVQTCTAGREMMRCLKKKISKLCNLSSIMIYFFHQGVVLFLNYLLLQTKKKLTFVDFLYLVRMFYVCYMFVVRVHVQKACVYTVCLREYPYTFVCMSVRVCC